MNLQNLQIEDHLDQVRELIRKKTHQWISKQLYRLIDRNCIDQL